MKIRISFIAIAITLFSVSVFAQDTTKVDATAASKTEITGRVVIKTQPQTVDVNITPTYTTGTKTVPKYSPKKSVKKPPTKKPTGYSTVKTTTLSGYTGTGVVSGSEIEAEVKIDTASVQRVIVEQTGADFTQLYENDGALEVRLGDVEVYVVKNKTDITQLYANDKALEGRMGANEKWDGQQQSNLDYLNKKKDKTTGWMDYLNLGLNGLNTVLNFKNMSDISKLKKGQNTSINGCRNNNGYANNRNGCGNNNGGSHCSRNMFVDPRRGCYNPPIAGNCTQRGNCNYNSGGPISVANGSGSPNGNFPNSSSGGSYSGGTTNSGGIYNTPTTSGGTYNTPNSNSGVRLY